MQIQQLRHLVAMVEQRSLARAAQALRLSQPALSKSLRRLEAYLGVPLFERTPRGIVPTEYGRTLAERARPITLDLREAERAIAAIRDGSEGRVTVGASPSPLRRVLPPAAARLMLFHPRLGIAVVAAMNDRLIEHLRAGEIDLVLSNLVEDRTVPDLRQETLYTDRVVVVGRAGHPLARRRALKPASLAPWRWVLPGPGVITRRHLAATFALHGLAVPEPAIEADSISYMASMLRASDLLAYLPEFEIGPGGNEPGLVEIDVPALAWVRPVGITVRRRGVTAPAAQKLIESVRAVCRDFPGRPRRTRA